MLDTTWLGKLCKVCGHRNGDHLPDTEYGIWVTYCPYSEHVNYYRANRWYESVVQTNSGYVVTREAK